MTADPEINPAVFSVATQKEDGTVSAILEDMFSLGYAKSGEVVVYEGEQAGKTIKITAEFRTVLPAEIRDIFEEVQKYPSFLGGFVTEQIETLARALIKINGMRLALDQNDRTDMLKELDTTSITPLNEARYILIKKIKSVHVLDALYDSYKKFIDTVRQKFEDSKKKLNSPPSSNLTSE